MFFPPEYAAALRMLQQRVRRMCMSDDRLQGRRATCNAVYALAHEGIRFAAVKKYAECVNKSRLAHALADCVHGWGRSFTHIVILPALDRTCPYRPQAIDAPQCAHWLQLSPLEIDACYALAAHPVFGSAYYERDANKHWGEKKSYMLLTHEGHWPPPFQPLDPEAQV